MLQAIRRREATQFEQALFAAWHTAAFGRAKRIPSWQDFRRSVIPDTRRPQSVDDQIEVARMLTNLFGGEDRTVAA